MTNYKSDRRSDHRIVKPRRRSNFTRLFAH